MDFGINLIMMKWLIKILIVVNIFVCKVLYSQSIEIGLNGGISNYNGDLIPKKSSEALRHSHFTITPFMKYKLNQYFDARGSFTYCKISGDDALVTDLVQKKRNLNFSSNIYEIAIGLDYNLLGYIPTNLVKPISPYLHIGIGGYYFNPTTSYNGQTINLQSVGTEGQGMPGFGNKFSLYQICIPFGGGLKYALSDEINVGFEINFRKTFTDYLDDVSGSYVNYYELLNGNGPLAAALGNRAGELYGTKPEILPTGAQRGNPRLKDWYITFGVQISYNITGSSSNFKVKNSYKNKKGCPSF